MKYSLQDTNRCVMCGMCLPHCPTYTQTRNEAESPRGRIALIQAMDRGALPASAALSRHLESCLMCRACEDMCPARVPYGALMDLGRAQLERRRWRLHRVALQALRPLLIYRSLRRIAERLSRIAGHLGIWRRVGSIPGPSTGRPARAPWPDYLKPGSALAGPSVGLFTGCVAEIMDRDTLAAATRVLTALGYHVVRPEGQVCCGAIHHHNGLPATSAGLIERNARAFGDPHIQAIVSTATGCGAFLSEADQLIETPQVTELARRHRDIVGFVVDSPRWPALRLSPSRARVAVHIPCSLAHVLKEPDLPFSLLGRVPGLQAQALPGNDRCCGAAGTYMITHRKMARTLGDDKVDAIEASGADIVVTPNIGCRIHLQAALSRRGLTVEVIHPVTLVARQLAGDRQGADRGPGVVSSAAQRSPSPGGPDVELDAHTTDPPDG